MTKLDQALAWALTKFRPIYIDEVVRWEQGDGHPQGRAWWSKEDIRALCEYPQNSPWAPLFWALHEGLGLIYKVRLEDRSHGYSFAADAVDRARMVRYAAGYQYGSAKRAARLLQAGTAPDALHPLDRESLEAESVKLYDKHKITLEQMRRSIEELDQKILTTEVLALLEEAAS